MNDRDALVSDYWSSLESKKVQGYLKQAERYDVIDPTSVEDARFLDTFVAPAMDLEMYRSTATRANIALLKERGVQTIGPEVGELASGLSGEGRMTGERMAASTPLPCRSVPCAT